MSDTIFLLLFNGYKNNDGYLMHSVLVNGILKVKDLDNSQAWDYIYRNLRKEDILIDYTGHPEYLSLRLTYTQIWESNFKLLWYCLQNGDNIAEDPKLYFAVLGLLPDVFTKKMMSEEEIGVVINTHYKLFAKVYHPDHNSNSDATDIMKLLNEAREVLSDKSKRSKYEKTAKIS